jgi:galactonate dehydratase
MNAMTLQLAATIPNFCILETISVDVPWRREIVRESLTFTSGEITIPDAPGLGLELDEEACARHPFQRHPNRHFDGGLTDIKPSDSVPFVTSAT